MSSCGEAASPLEKAEPVIRIEVLTFVAMVLKAIVLSSFEDSKMLKVPLGNLCKTDSVLYKVINIMLID